MRWFIFFCLALGLAGCQSPPEKAPLANACLYESIQLDQLDQVDSCLVLGANPNFRDEWGSTALHLAVRRKNGTLVGRLLRAGADPDLRRLDYYHSTPLMETAITNCLDCAKALLRADANMLLRDSFDDQALHWAAYYGRTELLDVLLDYGADPQSDSRQGRVEEIALRRHDAQLRQWLLDHPAWGHSWQSLGIPPLCEAAAKGDQQQVLSLLAEDVTIRQADPLGQTALTYAAAAGQEDVVNELLQYGLSPNWGSEEEGLFPLLLAAENGHVDIVQTLLAAGAKVDPSLRFSGYTPLMLAVRNGHAEVVEALLNAGADINARGLDGATVSDMLSFSRHPAIEQLLQQYLLR